jgi:hypothetical protein
MNGEIISFSLKTIGGRSLVAAKRIFAVGGLIAGGASVSILHANTIAVCFDRRQNTCSGAWNADLLRTCKSGNSLLETCPDIVLEPGRAFYIIEAGPGKEGKNAISTSFSRSSTRIIVGSCDPNAIP